MNWATLANRRPKAAGQFPVPAAHRRAGLSNDVLQFRSHSTYPLLGSSAHKTTIPIKDRQTQGWLDASITSEEQYGLPKT
jgi:hypothetical protein